MDGSEAPEPRIEKWELIQSSIPQNHPTQQSLVVIKDNYFHHEPAVFLPSHHDDLQVAPCDFQVPDESPSSLSSLSSASNSEASFGSSETPALSDLRARVVAETTKRLRLSWEVFKSKVISRFRRFVFPAASLWPVLPVAAMAALLLSLFYLKIRQPWRRTGHRDNEDRLLFLIKEKDEKISQLLLQVAQMNEKLSAPRRVPVLRIK